MADHKLVLEKRTITGKKLKNLRAEDKIPSVIYGADVKEPILAASDYNATEKVARAAGHHSPVDLTIDGKEQLALIKEVAIDPVTRRILNVSFQAISADAEVEATTPIVIENFEESEASKLHLAYLQVLEDIDVKAKPSDLKSKLVVDGSKLASTDDRLTIADIQLPAGVSFVDPDIDMNQVVANVYDPAAEAAAREAAEKAEAEAAAAAAAEAGEGEEAAGAEAPAEGEGEADKDEDKPAEEKSE